MKKVYNIYETSSGYARYVQTVMKKITAKMICRQHNREGEGNYMYIESYE